MFIFLQWAELDTRHSTLGSVVLSLPLELSAVVSGLEDSMPTGEHTACQLPSSCLPSFFP